MARKRKPKFTVMSKDYGRLSMWFQFAPPDEVTLADRILAEVIFRNQWDPANKPGQPGHSMKLSPSEAELVRCWFNHITPTVADESDVEYADLLDDFLARSTEKEGR